MKSKYESLIIDRPDKIPPGQKLTALGITLLFWGALLYLWQPLLSIIAWGLNIRLFYNHMILMGGYRTLLDLLVWYLAVIALLGGSLIFWARTNQWRFRGKERRSGIGATNVSTLATEFGLSAEEVASLSRHRVIAVTFDQYGKISVAPVS